MANFASPVVDLAVELPGGSVASPVVDLAVEIPGGPIASPVVDLTTSFTPGPTCKATLSGTGTLSAAAQKITLLTAALTGSCSVEATGDAVAGPVSLRIRNVGLPYRRKKRRDWEKAVAMLIMLEDE